jgi:hypothetical protein
LVFARTCCRIKIKTIGEQLEKKYLILSGISKWAHVEQKFCWEVINGASGRKGNSRKIAQFDEAIMVLDEEIEVLKLSNPEIKYFIDIFGKRKKNMGGDNISVLAIEIRKCYLALINKCEMFRKILKCCVEQLSDPQPGYISHSSINIAVPGR